MTIEYAREGRPKGPMVAHPGHFTKNPPRRLVVPEASPVTITRIDGTSETRDPYSASDAAAIIRGKRAGNKKASSTVRDAVSNPSPAGTSRVPGNRPRH